MQSVTKTDYIIVGTGITGATIARVLHDEGKQVILLDRRSCAGGNMHDSVHPSGIRVHTYGPHYFRTNSKELWAFVNRFSEFFPYKAVVQSIVDGRHESWPVNQSYLSSLSPEARSVSFARDPSSFEEACLASMPAVVYEKFVKGYTQKQWGTAPQLLARELAGRFQVREDTDYHFSQHTYQGIPLHGYTQFMRELIKDIPVILNTDYLAERSLFQANKLLVYTGPIDEFFDFELGRLRYRAQRREHIYDEAKPWLQPVGQVNNPALDNGDHVRTLEWKHMMPAEEQASAKGTVVTREYPYSPTDPNEFEYPFPDETNKSLYLQYRARADALPKTLICGRLGEYKYYDMDQALARALMLSKRILSQELTAVDSPC
jgi:UDP-galactopyranose mutase